MADDATRVRKEDVGLPLSRGEGNPLFRPGAPIRLGALRSEVVAFQVIVEAGAEPVRGVTVELLPFTLAGDTHPSSHGPLDGVISVERFVEHYVEVRRRSRNDRVPSESLGWSSAARPPDDRHTGFLPDALIPVEIAPPWAPYPLSVEPRESRAVWLDLGVSARAPAGVYEGKVVIRSSSHGELSALDLRLEVAAAELPYRPVSFLAFYDVPYLAERVGDGLEVEAQLLSLLHAHQIDGFTSILEPADVARLRGALDGSQFTAARGYRGPGEGVPPAVLPIGAYGGFGEPTPEALKRVEAVAELLPPAIEDVMLYAIDEQCESPRGPGWRRLVRGSRFASRLSVGHTCGEIDPMEQDVDLVLTPANRFNGGWTQAARGAGKKLWVYNGALPRSGSPLIDAPLTGLLANGWIAASYEVGRWFLWETAFWHDGNRGGRGPIDPFTVAENFHNRDGDSCLGDGMLVYPGTQRGPFASRSLGYPGVLPSMRLKSLRRGIQDAGYLALARAASPAAADAIVRQVVPAALDDVPVDAPVPWSSEGAPFFEARAALRALIPADAALDGAGVRRVLAEAAAARRALAPARGASPFETGLAQVRRRARWLVLAVVALGVAALAYAIARVRRGPAGKRAAKR